MHYAERVRIVILLWFLAMVPFQPVSHKSEGDIGQFVFAIASADVSMNAPEPYLLYPYVIVFAPRQQGRLEWLPVFIDR
ncbi:hypothetical protein QOS04_33275 [Cupriavidus sp. LEh21]|nr:MULTISPECIES: hypothetical protein [unclassified Cupriavidus]MDK2661433.1 hypothetical protein [Cupriavidus sp. LEh21]